MDNDIIQWNLNGRLTKKASVSDSYRWWVIKRRGLSQGKLPRQRESLSDCTGNAAYI